MFTNLFRLGRDADLRYLDNGNAVADLSLAYNYGMKGPDGKRPTQWVKGALWGKQAEALSQYLLKGGQIMATLDDVHVQEYTASDQTVRTTLAGRVLEVKLVSSPQQNQQPQQQTQQQRQPQQQTQQRRQAAPPPARAQQAQPQYDMDDDIPF
jgi:single-strand DNA-binding protein